MSKVKRVAFLTPEFPTEQSSDGGVGNYVLKMVSALRDQNIESEVFVPGPVTEFTKYQGILVHRIAANPSLRLRLLRRMRPILQPVFGLQGTMAPISVLHARLLAEALELRHRVTPFDVVQSSNYRTTGAFVRQVSGRPHLVRISTSRLLYDRSESAGYRLSARWLEKWDVASLRRADLVYAPSSVLANHFSQYRGINVRVLRPPAELGAKPTSQRLALPARYLVHFGRLGSRKGSDLVADALLKAWSIEPDLCMVWAGEYVSSNALPKYRALWGPNAGKVTSLGLLEKSKLYRIVADAEASVLPSQVDNFPNTVIESLLLNVPVIGSNGASIDELVVDGASGSLVPIGDSDALAFAMVLAWQRKAVWQTNGFRPPDVLAEMQPREAVQRFLRLVEEGRRYHGDL